MKKKLLLLCALFTAVTGAWAQNNVALNATITLDGAAVSFYTVDNRQDSKTVDVNEMNVFVDGNTNNNYRFAGWSTAAETEFGGGSGFIAQSFILNFGSAKANLNKVKVFFTNAYAKAFKIEYSTDNSTWAAWEDITNNTSETVTSDLATPVTAQYMRFSFTEANVTGWGIAIKEIEVYDNSAATLASFTISPAIVAAETETTLTASAFDNANNAYEHVKYQIDNVDVDLSQGQTLSEGVHIIKAIDTTNGEIAFTKTIYAVTSAPAAKTGAKHVAIYTSEATPTWTADAGSVLGDEITFSDGGKAKLVNLKQVNIAPASSDAVKNYNHATVAIFPVTDITTGAAVVNPGNLFKNFQDYQTGGLKAGQWNVVDYEINSDSEDKISAFRVHNDTGSAVDVLIANVVVYYKDPAGFDITTANGVATVTGAVTAEDIAEINAADAMVIDLTAVTSMAVGATAWNPTNKNAFVLVTGESAPDDKYEAIKEEANLGRYVTGTWFSPYKDFTIYDNGEKIWNGEGGFQDNAIVCDNANSHTYTITRTIATDKYVTTCLPASANVPANVEVYLPTAAADGVVTLTKQDITSLAAETPYILHTTAEATLTCSKTGVNWTPVVADKETEFGTSKFYGTLHQVADVTGKWALQGNQIKEFQTGANIGAFRAYFTDLPAVSDGAPAFNVVFVDGETTKIGNIDAEGNINGVGEAYNLNGQRVARPTKGLYIVNGKKVVMK